MSVRVLCILKLTHSNLIILLLHYMNFLYILEINFSSDVLFANILFPFCRLPFRSLHCFICCKETLPLEETAVGLGGFLPRGGGIRPVGQAGGGGGRSQEVPDTVRRAETEAGTAVARPWARGKWQVCSMGTKVQLDQVEKPCSTTNTVLVVPTVVWGC